MKRPWILIGTGALVLAAGLAAWTYFRHPGPSRAVAAIEALGGRVLVDETDPDRPVVAVDLTATAATDTDLELVASLPTVKRLYLGGTDVTGAGLAHLRGLTQLQELYLFSTRVDDSGLAQLAGMTGLRELGLSSTPVTDGGLVHLRGLTRLEDLYLDGTRVTPEGVKDLHQALPGLNIHLSSF
jgi:hypothetical protein